MKVLAVVGAALLAVGVFVGFALQVTVGHAVACGSAFSRPMIVAPDFFGSEDTAVACQQALQTPTMLAWLLIVGGGVLLVVGGVAALSRVPQKASV